MMTSIDKTYDVVILTHEPKDCLIESIEKIIDQTIIPQTIIIYNTNSDIFYKNITDKDRLTKLISDNKKTDIKVYHIDEEAFDHGKARNDAMKYGNSKFTLFMTDDAIPYDKYLSENLINAFHMYKDNVAVSYARQVPKNDASYKEKLIREYNYPAYDIVKQKDKEELFGIKNYFCSNVCAMYDNEIFKSLGGFEENIILNEDTFYVYNAIQKGYKIVYKSDAKVFHSHKLTYRQQFMRNFDIGVSQSEKKEIFDKIKSEKEGMKLLKYAFKEMFLHFHFISFIDFVIDSIYRYLGYKKGRRFEKLTIDECIKCANNKKYFIRKKNADN